MNKNCERSFSPPNFSKAHIQSLEQYESLYQESIKQPDQFWLKQCQALDWFQKPTLGLEYDWCVEKNKIEHTWFRDGLLNVTVNCLDRHLEKRGDKIALIWQGDEDEEVRRLTYRELHEDVCRLANVFKNLGIQKCDRVAIYMPLVPEAVIAMLASARIGAIHSVVFGGFSHESLAHRIQDSGCKLIITANVGYRGGKKIPLKQIADQAAKNCPTVQHVLVFKRSNDSVPMQKERDLWFHEEMQKVSNECKAEILQAEDPLFILYTSGSTGKPKGAVHTQAGYLLYSACTQKDVFDIQDEDIYWCTADIGWITGHSYVVYGPLANGSTVLLFEGIPTYPTPARFWQIIEKFHVTKFYTAPTAIRALISHGESWPLLHDLSSLRVLGTVGEPINPEAWMWYYELIGRGKTPIVDTWWQTETGGIMITPLPYCHTLKPGSASKPYFGVLPLIKDGALYLQKPWPGIMRTTWGDHQRFIDTYFKVLPNLYFTGDGAQIDEDGDYWLQGRMDDVVNIAGHRLGTAEIESVIVEHEAVAEAAVVPVPDDIRGQALCAFVTLVESATASLDLKKEIRELLRIKIGPIAAVKVIVFTHLLPKTRSGKIMRRILRKIAEDDLENLGDTTTLADPHLVHDLLVAKREAAEF